MQSLSSQPLTLFLDRDGVINQRLIGDYVRHPNAFVFLEGALEALVGLARKFDPIIVVTNQQGIGKGLMSEADLQAVHQHMLSSIQQAGGRIDAIYHCPDLAEAHPNGRKPNPHMALQAQADFPAIRFDRALMVGDSVSDLVFGQRLGMATVLLTTKPDLDQQAYAEVRPQVLAELPSLAALEVALEEGLLEGVW